MKALVRLVDLVETEMVISEERRIPHGGDPRFSDGYWQTHSFHHKLMEIVEEAKESIQKQGGSSE